MPIYCAGWGCLSNLSARVVRRYPGGPVADPIRAGGERPHKTGSQFDPFRTTGRHALASYTQQGMNVLSILFKTSRFNLSKVEAHFINPCCFGEDLAAWLRVKLIDRNIEVFQPYQEDWGWELLAKNGSDSYYLCMSGNSDESNTNRDEGEWRIIVEKRRSIWQRLRGNVARIIEELLSSESTIRDVHREE